MKNVHSYDQGYTAVESLDYDDGYHSLGRAALRRDQRDARKHREADRREARQVKHSLLAYAATSKNA